MVFYKVCTVCVTLSAMYVAHAFGRWVEWNRGHRTRKLALKKEWKEQELAYRYLQVQGLRDCESDPLEIQ